MLAANRRVFFFERFFVLDGLRLNVIDLRLAALPRVAIEQARLGTAEPDLGEFFGKIDGVVDAAVHAHAADRIVHMGAIADEQHATLVEGLGYTLMHRVERVIGNIIVAALLMDTLQTALETRNAQCFLIGLRLRHREYAAPDARRSATLDFEQIDPFIGIGEVIARAIAPAGGAEVEARADLDEAFGPGKSHERDLGKPPYRTAAAVGAYEVFAAEFFRPTAGSDDRCLDAVAGLRETDEFGRKAYLADAARVDMGQCGVHQFVLLPLHHIRVRHFTLEKADVELGDQLASHAVTEMKQRRWHAARRQL